MPLRELRQMCIPRYWIARVTLDVYQLCLKTKRIGASAKTCNRLAKMEIGDRGVFYISTSVLHKSETIAEFRTPFAIVGKAEKAPIPVPTLPKDKQITQSAKIEFATREVSAPISSLISSLTFIKKKDHWGSYLMQAFIEISQNDFQKISAAMK